MSRPRTHDIDLLLDAAEGLLAAGGVGGVTIRGVADATGASSGSIYHAFGSRSDLVGRVWLRAAERYLDAQEAAMERELGTEPGTGDPLEAVVAVASVPAVVRQDHPESAAVLLRHRRDEFLALDLTDGLREEIEKLEGRLLAVLRRLGDALWNRQDRAAIETVAICVVDLPSAILMSRRPRVIDPLPVLDSAVRGVVTNGPAHRLP